MERAEWLKRMHVKAEALYDHLAPAYWITFGMHTDTAHRQFIKKFLGRLRPQSTILDAGCGAGRYDGMFLEAGHSVLGIDQSSGMLARAREHFPQEHYPRLRYVKMSLQEMDFQAEYDGVVCIEAMEHINPEDWPVILDHFQKALNPGGVFYTALDMADWDAVGEAYKRARALGLPVVFGEVVDKIDTAYTKVMAQDWQSIAGEQADGAVYHYYPPREQVQAWFDQAGLVIEEEGIGNGYEHLLVRKNV